MGGELLRESLGSDPQELHLGRWDARLPRPDGSNRSRIALTSAPISVLDGDYFECQVWQNSGADQDVEADPKTWFGIVAIQFAAFRGALVRLTATEPVAASTEVAIPWDAIV